MSRRLVLKLRINLALFFAALAWFALRVYSVMAHLAAGAAPPDRAGEVRLALVELAEEWAWRFTRPPEKPGEGGEGE